MITILQTIQLVLVGLLAGEELTVRYGVQPALNALSDSAHVEARIALVHRLKVVVPMLIGPTVLATVAVMVVAGGEGGLGWRVAGTAALVGFLLLSFLGTVPINMGVNDWNPDDPPDDWRQVVRRWQALDTFRSAAATVAFVLFAIAAALTTG